MLPQDVRACMWIFECMQVDVVFGAGEREMGLRWRREGRKRETLETRSWVRERDQEGRRRQGDRETERAARSLVRIMARDRSLHPDDRSSPDPLYISCH